ncbi:ATP-binding cassette sub-family G member 2 [Schistosoma japonicum]|nr:ATP-binding cassette sub-family G member 2 [Schistosoma japonicum]
MFMACKNLMITVERFKINNALINTDATSMYPDFPVHVHAPSYAMPEVVKIDKDHTDYVNGRRQISLAGIRRHMCKSNPNVMVHIVKVSDDMKPYKANLGDKIQKDKKLLNSTLGIKQLTNNKIFATKKAGRENFRSWKCQNFYVAFIEGDSSQSRLQLDTTGVSPLKTEVALSLLDVLAGRKNPSQLTGYVLLNGQFMPSNVRRRLCGYVVQVKAKFINYSIIKNTL